MANFLYRLELSWRLFGATWRLWRATPMLWAWVLGGIGVVWVLWLPLAWPVSQAVLEAGEDAWATAWWAIAWWVVLNLCRTALSFAVAAAVHARLDGDAPDLDDMLDAVVTHLWDIVVLTCVHSLVAAALDALRERLGWLGELLSHLLLSAWGWGTSLTVPALVMRPGLSVQEGLEESWTLVRRTWGENLMSQASLGLALGMLTLGVLMSLGLLGLVGARVWWPGASPQAWVNGAFMAIWGWWVLTSAYSDTLDTVLYRYALQGEVPDDFDADDLRHAFVPKREDAA